MQYVEFQPGEKYPGKGADVSDTPDSFRDAGVLLTDNDLVIDIDCLPKDVIEKMIVMFKIETQTVWTDRGVHFYFKKPEGFRGANRTCALGFPIEFKHKKNTEAVTIKRNGEMRTVENKGVREDLPAIFGLYKKFDTLLGFDEGDGRNNALFKHRTQVSSMSDWRNVLRFINNFIFADPLPEDEFQTIVRDMVIEATKDNEPEVAQYLIQEYKIVRFNGRIFFRLNGRYEFDRDVLIRLVISKVGDQKTRYIDEVMKQIEYRSELIDKDKIFDIQFNNGILRRGKFIEVEYEEFTPYTIDVNYDPDAEPVQIVDDYIDHLTKSDPDYRQLLMEILAHTLIVDPEFKRMLAKFFIFVGGGGNGKGTLLQIIKHILQQRNCSGLSIKNMSDERYFVTMKGKLANLGDDIQDQPIDNEQMKQLKNISSCDYVASRELYKQSEDVQLTTSLIFTSNHVIKSFEKGKSYSRRVMWLPMYTEVDEDKKDPQFIEKLSKPKSLEYWIRLIVEGYFRLYENQGFTKCKIVQDYNDSYHKENNSARMFLEDLTEEDIHHKRSPEVYNEYEVWAEENGLNVGSQKMLKEAIREVFNMGTGTKKINGRSSRVFMRPDETDQELSY